MYNQRKRFEDASTLRKEIEQNLEWCSREGDWVEYPQI